MKKTLFISAAVCSLALFSCGKKDTVDTGAEKKNLGPAETVQNWSKDMSDGRIASLWDALPASYQSDVSGVVTEFANNTDEEVYNESQKLMGSLTSLLKNKKDIVLAIADKQIPDDKAKAQIKDNYDTVLGLLGAVTDSDAKTLSGLKDLDIQKFLGAVQPHMKDIMALAAEENPDLKAITSMTTKLISEEGDTAELEVSVDGDTENVKVVKVEDRWIPEDLQKDWAEGLAEAKKGINESSEMLTSNKEATLKTLKAIQKTVADLETASNENEMMGKLMKASQELGPMVMGLMMGGGN